MVLDPNRKRLGFFYAYGLLSRASSWLVNAAERADVPGVSVCPDVAQSANGKPVVVLPGENTPAGRAWAYRG